MCKEVDFFFSIAYMTSMQNNVFLIVLQHMYSRFIVLKWVGTNHVHSSRYLLSLNFWKLSNFFLCKAEQLFIQMIFIKRAFILIMTYCQKYAQHPIHYIIY